MQTPELTKAHRHALEPSEDVFEGWIIDLAKMRGWRIVHFRKARTKDGWATPIRGDKGFPDLVMARKGRVIFAELKVKDNKPDADQELWLDALRGTAAETYVWWPKDWDNDTIEGILK